MGDRWSVKITGTLELTRSLDDVENIKNAFSMQYMTYGYQDFLASAAEDEMLSIQGLCAVHNPVFNNLFVHAEDEMVCSIPMNQTNVNKNVLKYKLCRLLMMLDFF